MPRKTVRRGGLFGMFKTYKPDPESPIFTAPNGSKYTWSVTDSNGMSPVIMSKDGKTWSLVSSNSEKNAYLDYVRELKDKASRAEYEETKKKQMESWNAASEQDRIQFLNYQVTQLNNARQSGIGSTRYKLPPVKEEAAQKLVNYFLKNAFNPYNPFREVSAFFDKEGNIDYQFRSKIGGKKRKTMKKRTSI